jgi:hypothetical protein
MKLELEFEITKTGDDSVEGTWQTSDEGEQSMMAEYIRRYIASSDVILAVWGIDSPEALDRLIKRLDVSFYGENGREGYNITSGTFTAWKYGIPA